MSNKTSDKNVANIEDIEDFILELKDFELNKNTLEVANALEDILAEREQDKKRIQELEAKLLDMIQGTEIINKETPEYVKENYIPKQAVIDKIDELKLSGGSNGKDNVENLVRELAIDILQELLEGERK